MGQERENCHVSFGSRLLCDRTASLSARGTLDWGETLLRAIPLRESPQECASIHSHLLKVVEPKKILHEQAKNLMRLNKSNRALMEQVKALSHTKGDLDRKTRAFKQLQTEHLQVQVRRDARCREEEHTASLASPPSGVFAFRKTLPWLCGCGHVTR